MAPNWAYYTRDILNNDFLSYLVKKGKEYFKNPSYSDKIGGLFFFGPPCKYSLWMTPNGHLE